MAGNDSPQPKPNGPLPTPESYDRESCGPKPERPGLVAIWIVSEPVPVTRLAANFSPMPRIAPPPLGSETEGTLVELSPILGVAWESPFVPITDDPQEFQAILFSELRYALSGEYIRIPAGLVIKF